MANTTYHVKVESMICEDIPDAQESKTLGYTTFTSETEDEAEKTRDSFALQVLTHPRQSHQSTLWRYDDDKEDWIEMGSSGVLFSNG